MRTHFKMLFIFALLFLGCHTSNFPSPAPVPSQVTRSTLPVPQTAILPIPTEPMEYPTWFWNPPTELNSPTAVGYSSASTRRPELAIEAATQDGLKQLEKVISVRIHGERISINTVEADNFQEDAPAWVQQLVAEHHKVLATYTSPKLTLVLLGLEEVSHFSHFKTIPPTDMSEPAWVQRLTRQKGYLYGRGHGDPRYRPENAWQRAEYHARIDLALNFQSQIRHVAKSLNAHIQMVTSTQTDVVLNGIEVIGRWFDINNQTYHVLVRAPISKNTETVRQQLHQVSKPSDNSSQQSQEEMIRRAFEELDSELSQTSPTER